MGQDLRLKICTGCGVLKISIHWARIWFGMTGLKKPFCHFSNVRKGKWNQIKCICFLLLADFFSLSLVTVPEVFAKVKFTQFPFHNLKWWIKDPTMRFMVQPLHKVMQNTKRKDQNTLSILLWQQTTLCEEKLLHQIVVTYCRDNLLRVVENFCENRRLCGRILSPGQVTKVKASVCWSVMNYIYPKESVFGKNRIS